ncbi:MAG TPA: mechanosensitive ion channel domain-containing protein [Burkholderiales bacterium]|nr:mechanosensitive ion channel domain-containing protein [Burkholderiales bacterium]
MRLAFLLAAACCAGAAFAQSIPSRLPGLAPASKAESPAAAQPPAPIDALDASLEKRIADARAELERIGRQVATREGVPAGVPNDALIERRATAERLVRSLEQTLDNERILVETQRRRAELGAKATAWTGFPTAPPYSLLLVDELRGAAAAARDRLEAAQSKVKLLEAQGDLAREHLSRAQVGVRQAAERADGAAGDQRALAAWERDTAELRARFEGAQVALTERARRLALADADEARDELAFLDKQLRVASAAVTFPRADLDRILARLAVEREALEREAAQMRPRTDARRKEYEAAQAELDAARGAAAKAGDGGARVAQLERALDLRRLQAQNAEIGYDLQRALIDVNGFSRSTWEGRFELAASSDAAKKRSAYESVVGYLKRVEPWREYVANELAVVRGRIAQSQNQIAVAGSAEDAAAARDLLDAWREREVVYARVQSAIDRERATLERWKEEFEGTRGVRPYRSYALDAWYAAAGIGRSIWNFEMFTAEDTVEVDGRKITSTRSVTVGKSVGAVVLLVLGYLVVSWLVRRLERALVGRFKADPAAARIVRRWLQVILIAVLFVLALDLVKIPLTVFAFLGGALAIGFGFGAQVMIKNFISGVMLLIERPLKVGDIVQIGDIIGTVTNISIRSSTIRTADGIETLIPNSTFVESNVTNWTYSTPRVRRAVKVGVAYGSDTRKVSDTLLSVAERHGQILKDPPPRVIFEDFGADGLAFSLEYWIDYAKGADSRQIGSDVRFMVEKALAEAGVAIPYPQRDVHVDASAPLRVEVVSRAETQRLRGAAPG